MAAITALSLTSYPLVGNQIHSLVDSTDKSDDIYIQDIVLTVSRLCAVVNSDWLPSSRRIRRSDVFRGIIVLRWMRALPRAVAVGRHNMVGWPAERERM